MKKLILVIGERNSGKSTLIRSLTGCKPACEGFVEDRKTGRRIYVVDRSPQEHPLNGSFKKIIGVVGNDKSASGIVMAIQPTSPWKRLSMEQIVSTAQDTFQPYAFVLNPAYKGKHRSDLTDSVRRRLQPFNLQCCEEVDARRFAYLNAARIRGKAGMHFLS